mmetsp:Transcript_9553/g.15235  ORF Transcript_9553/g.15235 Transcript_9553/m.15235 type:complete len:197 (-) Transcript_9553:52-642(-)
MAAAQLDLGETGALKLVIQNTFLHVVDDKTRSKMNRSFSDSDISSIAGSKIVMSNDDGSSEITTYLISARERCSTEVEHRAAHVNLELRTTHYDVGWASDHLHNIGQCRPCLHFLRKRGCWNGNNCAFCHLEHKDKPSRPRPCKAKRQQCHRALALLQVVHRDDPDSLALAQKQLSKQSAYIQRILKPPRGSTSRT